MFATVTLLTNVHSVSGAPYVSGVGFSARDDMLGPVSSGDECRDWPAHLWGPVQHRQYEKDLLARGFQYGSQPGALNVGWIGGHTAATLPDGTPVSSW